MENNNMKYKIGQIVFFKGSSLFGKLISIYNYLVYGESKATHVGIITNIQKDGLIICEALRSGVVENFYLFDDLLDKEIGIPKIKLTDVYKNSLQYVGIKYSWIDIISIFFDLILSIKFKSLRTQKIGFTGKTSLICSEVVVRILYDSSNKKLNFEKEYDKSFDKITPMDIYKSKFINGN